MDAHRFCLQYRARRAGAEIICAPLGRSRNPRVELMASRPRGYVSLLVLSLLALLVGVASGLIGAVFRLTLEAADRFRSAAIVWAHGGKFAGFLLVVGGCAAAVAT